MKQKLDEEGLPKLEGTRSKTRNQPKFKSQNWDDDDDWHSNSEFEPTLLPCARADKEKAEEDGQGPSGAAKIMVEEKEEEFFNRQKQPTEAKRNLRRMRVVHQT